MVCQKLRVNSVPITTLAVAASIALAVSQPTVPDSHAVVSSFILDHEAVRIDGTPTKLTDFQGKVILIVNTASRCGLTPQYEGLEKLYQDKKDDGFVILGFPANNFAGQEPGSNAEIAKFCAENYDVTFPMFEKISVLGENRHPLYLQLSKQPSPIGGDPEWNFAKYLVNREGRVVLRFPSKTKPSDAEFVEAIEDLLSEEAPES